MKSVLVTPLFPPDPSDSARYAKLLAEKISTAITVIAYGQLPESVPNVTIHSISKRTGRLVRLFRCFKLLLKEKPTHILLLNGPSTELPALVYSYFSSTTVTYIISDPAAQTDQTKWQRWLSTKLQQRAQNTITIDTAIDTYLPPEWLPFTEVNTGEQTAYETWWDSHLTKLAYEPS